MEAVEAKKKKRPASKQHNFRKRKPVKAESGKNVLYVSNNASLNALQASCDKIISDGENEVIIHALGAAVQRGILLALQIVEKNAIFKIDANTLTTELTDDLEPTTDEDDYLTQRRFNSAIRIRVFRDKPLDIPQCSLQSTS